MKLAVAALEASENVMFATDDHKVSPEASAVCSAAVQFEAASNQKVTFPPGVPGVLLPHLLAKDVVL